MSSPTPAVPGYRDFAMVAHGSTAFVYRAVQERLDRTVAVKVLLVDDDMTTADSVGKELEATVAVSNHPHIVSIIDTGHTDTGQPYIVMEYCEGGSYSAVLKADGPLPVPDVLDVGVKIGQALQAAHQADILHRDVKPQNILRGQYGPALADFGIARTPAALSATAAIDKLTPLHASPEALLRQAQTAASDLFSLASSMWHLLAGHAPFANPKGGTDPDTHRQRVTSDVPPPKLPRDDVPEWLEGLLVRSLSRDPARRPASCQEFADELQRGMYGQGVAKAPSVIGDVSNEVTVYRPEVASRGTRVPLDPFAPAAPPHSKHGNTLGGAVTGGGTGGGYDTQLGSAVDPRYAALNDLPRNAPPISGAPMSVQPFSGAPQAQHLHGNAGVADPGVAPAQQVYGSAGYAEVAPPQTPVSMNPPATPWAAGPSPGAQQPHPAAPQGVQAAPHSAPPERVFAPPVIGREGHKQRKAKAYKAPKQVRPRRKDDRSLKGYVYLGLAVSVVLGLVMTLWLWLIVPNQDEDDLDQADTTGQGAPQDVAITEWSDGQVTLTWTAPAEGGGLSYIVFAQRVGDEEAEAVNPEGTTDTTYTAGGFVPTEDYCFNVGAVWSVDSVPMSEAVCTADLAD